MAMGASNVCNHWICGTRTFHSSGYCQVHRREINKDSQGYAYKVDAQSGAAYRITPCCQVAAGIDENGLTFCKGCHRQVDYKIGMNPTK